MNKSLLGVALLAALYGNANAETVFWQAKADNRLQFVLEPDFPVMKSADPEVRARAWIQSNSNRLGVDANQLTLQNVKESLTAQHFHFQQMINGIPVLHSEVIVSVAKSDGRIMRAYNTATTIAVSQSLNKSVAITADSATDIAWQALKASDLTAVPRTELVYAQHNDQLVLAYRSRLTVQQPRGAWEALIDAQSGEVLSIKRRDTPNKQAPAIDLDTYRNDKHGALQQELALLAAKTVAERVATTPHKMFAAGTAKVFDPDPRTTMNTASYEDNSAIPEAAYLTRDLRDITLNGGTYRLTGPWVTIADFDAPNTAPSTTTTGDWSAFRRGNNAFNDAMTYFHLDQNQRYIQSLGFTGTTGIQQGSLMVDADGAGGADNSYYDPNNNRLSFGHGGVDDNEDADVILHEYGHALQHNINNNWDGGDTGAMGEGFGDYWAGSYSISTTPNGATFNPHWVFSWDGHNLNWGGRVMNQTSYRYDSTRTYGAHAMVGGVLSDELWSTPLFQSLQSLIAAGRTRAEVDRIILDAHFGLGANIKMPQMAQAIVQSAGELYATGPHAEVLRSQFMTMNILQDPSNNAPSISVSNDTQTVNAGATVSFTATVTDADGDSVTLSWARVSGPSVSLNGATTATVSFVAPSANTAQTVVLRLTATDARGGVSTKDVTANINAASDNGDGGDGGGGGSWPALALSLLLLAIPRRR